MELPTLYAQFWCMLKFAQRMKQTDAGLRNLLEPWIVTLRQRPEIFLVLIK